MKIIAAILIYSFLIQIVLMNVGCMSYYPVKGEYELDNYKNYKDNILVKLKNKTEVEVIPQDLLYLQKNSKFRYGEGDEYDPSSRELSYFRGIIFPSKRDSENSLLTDLKKLNIKYFSSSGIDSERIIVNNSTIYHLFWLKNRIRLNFKDGNFILITDSVRNFWVAVDPYKKEFRKMNNSNIERIEIQKIDWVKTSIYIPFAIALCIGTVIFFIQENRGRLQFGWSK